MSQIFLGISPFYFHGAEGHYGRVHPALLNGIKEVTDTKETIHLYFGAEGLTQQSNVIGNVDPSFKNPTGFIMFSRIIKLAREIELACADKESFIYVYEGTIPFLLSLKLAEANGVKINAIVNLHQVEVFKSLLNDVLVKFVHRRIIKSSLKNPGSVLISTESQLSAILLGKELGYNLDVFPIFSTFSSAANSSKGERPNLVLFSGDFDENLMIKDLEGIAIPGSRTIVVDARISNLASPEFLAYLSGNQYQVIDQRIPEDSYRKLFDSVSKVWLLYRLQVNVLGSSGRLMDAISFGHEVVVPKNSALQDFALESTAQVSLIDLETYVVEKIEEKNRVRGENGLIEKYDTDFAVKELFRMWNKNLQLQNHAEKRSLNELRGAKIFLTNTSVFIEWALLQISLVTLRIKMKLRRLVLGIWNLSFSRR